MSDPKTPAPKPGQSLTDQAGVLNAQAAMLTAQAALQKAQTDSLPASGTSGAVTANAGAGNREATLLAAKALERAADKVVGKIKDALGKELLIVAGPPLALPNFEAFQIQAEIVRLTFDRATHVLHALEKALEDFEKPKHDAHNVWSLHPTADHVNTEWLKARITALVAPTATPDRAGIAPAAGAAAAAALAIAAPALLPVIGPFGGAIAAVGAAVDVAAKLATYFKPDFSIGTATPAGADDQLLATCVAHAVTSHHHHTAVHVQGLWNGLHRPDALAGLLAPLIEASQKLAGLAEEVRRKASLLTAAKAKDPAPPTPPTPPGTPPTPPATPSAPTPSPTLADNARANLANAVAAALDFYTAAEKGFDALVGSLAAAGKDGMPAASAVLQEKAIADFLAEGGHVLWVKVSSVVSSSYTKKSWWPTLNIPFYVASGAVVEYALTRGKSGALLKAGTITEPGKFISVNELVDQAGKSHDHFLGLFENPAAKTPHDGV